MSFLTNDYGPFILPIQTLCNKSMAFESHDHYSLYPHTASYDVGQGQNTAEKRRMQCIDDTLGWEQFAAMQDTFVAPFNETDHKKKFSLEGLCFLVQRLDIDNLCGRRRRMARESRRRGCPFSTRQRFNTFFNTF